MEEVKKRGAHIPAKILSTVPDLLSTAIWIAAGFTVSGTTLFGRITPFGAAAAAASGRSYALGSAIGAILGYSFSENPENKLRCIGAVLMVFGIRLVTERFISGDIPAVLTAAAATAFASFGYAAVTVISGYNGALALAETIIAAGSTYFFRRTASALEHGKPVLSLSGGDRACVIMSAAIAAASLVPVTFGKISLGGIAASAIILFASLCGHEGGGAVAGIAAGTAISFAGEFSSEALSAYALGGLICGVFSVFGKLGSALSFLAVRLMFCLLSAGNYPEFTGVYESLVSVGIFMLVPEKAMRFISAITLRGENSANPQTVKELILSKMGRAADGLSDISSAVRRVSSALGKDEPDFASTVLNFAAAENCARCSKRFFCWEKNRPFTEKAFYELEKAASNGGEIPSEPDFSSVCPNSEKIFRDIVKTRKEKTRELSFERKVRELREVINEQFDATALFLRDSAAEAADISGTDKKLSLAIRNVFEGRGLPLFACTCYYSAGGNINIEVSGPKEKLRKAEIPAITEDISEICGCEISKPVRRDTENARRLIFFEKPPIKALFGFSSVNAEGEKFCGDSFEHFTDAGGCAHAVLSDGMGSGEHAALGAMMTCALISRMVRAGFRYGSAIKLVNGALLLKGDEESLATVDAFSVNLYSGAADFYKAGAEASFIIKDKKVTRIESVSLPAGILCGAEFEKSSIRLSPGDAVLLVTDGITSGGSEWIPSEFRSLAEKSPDEIAAGIVSTAGKRRLDGHSDDMTAVVIKLVSAD